MTQSEQVSIIKMVAREEGINLLDDSLVKQAHEYADKSILEENTGIKQSVTDYYYEVKLFFLNI